MNKIQGVNQFNDPVKDITQAKVLYSPLLGVEPYMGGGKLIASVNDTDGNIIG